MNLIKSMLMNLGVLAMATTAYGDFSSTDLLDASKIVVEEFEVSNSHAEHLVGYKVWKSGADAMVKIYVDHNGHAMEFDFLCEKYDDATECYSL